MWTGYCLIVYVPFSVRAMAWLGEHCEFVEKEFINNGGSVFSSQRAFRT